LTAIVKEGLMLLTLSEIILLNLNIYKLLLLNLQVCHSN